MAGESIVMSFDYWHIARKTSTVLTDVESLSNTVDGKKSGEPVEVGIVYPIIYGSFYPRWLYGGFLNHQHNERVLDANPLGFLEEPHPGSKLVSDIADLGRARQSSFQTLRVIIGDLIKKQNRKEFITYIYISYRCVYQNYSLYDHHTLWSMNQCVL